MVIKMHKAADLKKEEGGTVMKKLLMALAVPFLAVSIAGAVASHTGQTDSCEVWMIANVTYSVCIDTGQGNGVAVSSFSFNAGLVNLNQVYLSTWSQIGNFIGMTTATVFNNGNVSEDWKIKCEKLVPAQVWSLRYIPTTDTNATMDSVGLDSATLCVMLTPFATSTVDVAVSTSPGAGLPWKNANMVDCGSDGLGVFVPLDGTHVSNVAGFADGTYDGGNNVPKQNGGIADPLAARRLWLRLRTPSDTTVNSMQKFRLTIQAGSSSQF